MKQIIVSFLCALAVLTADLEIEAQCQQLYAELEFTKEKASNVMGSAAGLQA